MLLYKSIESCFRCIGLLKILNLNLFYLIDVGCGDRFWVFFIIVYCICSCGSFGRK